MNSGDGPYAYTYSPDTNSFIQTEIQNHTSDRPPHVLIIGAGLGGLLLGNLLEIAKIPYQIFERSKVIKPAGSVSCLTENIFPALEQLGLYDELKKFSHLAYEYNFYSDDMKKIGILSGKGYKKSIGYTRFLLRRSNLVRTLLNRIPPGKIHLGKRLLSYTQNNEGVKARFNNNTTYIGDILIGADGAHSAVRQLMYKELEGRDQLPDADKQKSTKGFSSIVGATSSLETDKYPGIAGPKSEASLMVGSSPTLPNWSTISVAGNQICWNVISQLDAASFEEKQFRTTEWTVETNQQDLDEIRHLKTPYGTMGDLIDATPKDHITRVLLEDRLFETWTHGRVALIGDACHKLLPSTGQGVVNALMDAVVLANNLYDLERLSYSNIKGMLRDYREQRYQNVKELYTSSQLNAMVQYGHTFLDRVLRQTLLNLLPARAQKRQYLKESAYRPQIAFLPQVPIRGTVKVLPQRPSKRYNEEIGRRSSEAMFAKTTVSSAASTSSFSSTSTSSVSVSTSEPTLALAAGSVHQSHSNFYTTASSTTL